LFEITGARSLRARHIVRSGAPLSLRLGELEDGDSVFAYRRDGRLVGRTFDGGTKFLHIDYALDPTRPERTMVRVTPELRKYSASRHWQNIDGRLREAPRYEGELYDELGTDARLEPGEFLVIGPSETAELRSVVGSRFLTTPRNNLTYETVICLTPQPVRAASSGR
ncbi:MAG: hypothetical protein GY842_02925, partial [bacterium]|nr:hypothetical protein [bacterium]